MHTQAQNTMVSTKPQFSETLSWRWNWGNIPTQTGPQATELWPELLDDSPDCYKVGGEDKRGTDNGSRDPWGDRLPAEYQ